MGIATGALAVLLPERPFDFERDILQRMRTTQTTGKKHFIIIVSEGVIGAQELANQIQAATGVDSRATVLGHIQRGGSPTVRDRVNASLMGYHAVDLLDRGIYNRVVAVSGGKVVDYDVNVALSMHKDHRRPRDRDRQRDFHLNLRVQRLESFEKSLEFRVQSLDEVACAPQARTKERADGCPYIFRGGAAAGPPNLNSKLFTLNSKEKSSCKPAQCVV